MSCVMCQVITTRHACDASSYPCALLSQGIGTRAVFLDMLGRDFMVLGRCIAALGTLAECSAPSPVAAPVASALLSAVRHPAIHAHPQPFVRRMALLGAVQGLNAVSPATAAGALTAEGGDALGESLGWIR